MTVVPLRPAASWQPPAVLQVYTARELCEQPDPLEAEQLLGPLIVRRQRLVLGGHTGEGKTTLALQAVRAVLHGKEMLGWRGAGTTKALIVDAEQGLRTIKRRLHEADLADETQLDYLRVPG